MAPHGRLHGRRAASRSLHGPRIGPHRPLERRWSRMGRIGRHLGRYALSLGLHGARRVRRQRSPRCCAGCCPVQRLLNHAISITSRYTRTLHCLRRLVPKIAATPFKSAYVCINLTELKATGTPRANSPELCLAHCRPLFQAATPVNHTRVQLQTAPARARPGLSRSAAQRVQFPPPPPPTDRRRAAPGALTLPPPPAKLKQHPACAHAHSRGEPDACACMRTGSDPAQTQIMLCQFCQPPPRGGCLGGPFST